MIILLVVAAGSRNNFELLMATVGVFMVPGYFRIARSQTLAVRGEPTSTRRASPVCRTGGSSSAM